LRFKIDWASLIVGSKFTDLLCFTLYLRAIFQVQAPGGLIFGGAYFRNFTVVSVPINPMPIVQYFKSQSITVLTVRNFSNLVPRRFSVFTMASYGKSSGACGRGCNFS